MSSADLSGIVAALERLRRRAIAVRFVEGGAAAIAGLALYTGLRGAPALLPAVVIVVTLGGLWAYLRRPSVAVIAAAVERCDATAQNVVVTAEQLARAAERPPEAVIVAVVTHAERAVLRADPRRVVRDAPALLGLGCAIALYAAAWWAVRDGAGHASLAGVAGSRGGVTAVVTPPAYLRRPRSVVTDPERLTVMRGSALAFSVRESGDSLEIRTASAARTVLRGHDGAFHADVAADSDGFVSLRIHGADPATMPVRLIPIIVNSDSAPRVSITSPGRDLLLPNGNQSIALVVRAADDIALSALRLRFTRVSGSGERFTFTEGEVPLTISRRNTREWEATARWDLVPLKLDAGDMVVYRATAADERPGALPAESDALIAEVAAPGGVAAAGFALDPEQERYALSQQMVILKTERLLAAKARMSADSFASGAAEIAMEQRRVRAEFVFMMGGEMEDAPQPDDASMTDLNEEAEAAGEDELAAGRMVNRGRVALLGSIRNMSRAAAALTAVDVPTALTHERAALKQLETAFSHSRIILRALAERERLDLSRRLGGALGEVVGARRVASVSALAPIASAALDLLREAATIGADRPVSAPKLATLAERALRLGPSDPLLQLASKQLTIAATRAKAGESAATRLALDEATIALQRVIRERSAASVPREDEVRAVRLGRLRDSRGSSVPAAPSPSPVPRAPR